MEDIYEDALETYQKKNDDYGDSWKKVGVIKQIMNSDDMEIVEKEDSTVITVKKRKKKIDSVEDEVVDGMLTRMLDKIVRINELKFFTDKNVDENLDDSAGDLGNYAFMLKKYLL
jgi:hypothetical protein